MLEGGHAVNALPQTARAKVNCRILPGESVPDVKETLQRVLADDQITLVQIGEPILSAPSALNPEVMGAIKKITGEMWPGTPVVPFMSAGGTDGSALRNAGIPTYGQTGLSGEVEDVRVHGKDERVSVEAFYKGLDYHYRLIKALSEGHG
jgi:acetylornithine deacetylase/succinyl-diaminopimelate desuccinylase-like protein